MGWIEILSAMLLSFILSMTISAVYRWTFQGLSYSRSFIHTQILASIITTVLIIAIGNNLARGLGILGTLAIVRFRTPVRDPRDIIFLFATIAIGIACGAHVFMVGIMGTLFFCGTALLLHWSPYASRRDYEGLLRFTLPLGAKEDANLARLFETYCSSFNLMAMREAVQGNVMEFAWQVRLRDASYRADLLEALHQIEDIGEVSLLMQRATVEI